MISLIQPFATERIDAGNVGLKTKQRELTPQYIEYTKWSKWNGALPSTILGSGQNVLLGINK